ncbi:hypothetical protein BGZ76_002914, partial [Entomortierella beljakovae]
MNQPPNPLEIPEILSRVGLYIPLWVHFDYSTRVRGLRPRYAPQHLLNCILVNKTWHDILLPILWFTMDDISIPSIPNAVNILSRHSVRLRILELSHFVPEILSIPLTLLPRNLIHLDLSGLDNNHWARALDLSSFSSSSPRIQFERSNSCNGKNIGEPEVILPHLTSLAVCKDMESGALEALVRHCPGLEELSWMGSNDGDLKQLTTNLRECCPSLSSLTYSTVEVQEDESVYAALIQSVPHLVELQIKIPALGDAFTDALIKHAHTLDILDMRITGQHENCDRNLERILKSCHQITALSIEGTKCGATNLFSFNWACQRLNRLFLTGLHSITHEPQTNEDCESVAAVYGWATSPCQGSGGGGGEGGGGGGGGGEGGGGGGESGETESEDIDSLFHGPPT